MDTREQSSEDRREIESLVEESNFFGLQPDSTTSTLRGAADYYKYKISIKKDDVENLMETTDLTMDNRIRPLVDYLVKEAMKAKVGKT